MSALATFAWIVAVVFVLALAWFMLSSCLGEPLRRLASAWWFYAQETARAERRKNGGRFPGEEQFEMETRRRNT